jgi:hypothetical protein
MVKETVNINVQQLAEEKPEKNEPPKDAKPNEQ